jgi:hypothetical protein
MCILGDGDGADVWEQRPHVARKARRCDCCRSTIRPGQPYEAHFSVYEGEAYRESICFPCWLAREEFSEAHDDIGCMPSGVRDLLHDCIDENGEDDPASARWSVLLADIEARATLGSARG